MKNNDIITLLAAYYPIIKPDIVIRTHPTKTGIHVCFKRVHTVRNHKEYAAIGYGLNLHRIDRNVQNKIKDYIINHDMIGGVLT